jgi:hypothetical protein
VVQKGEVELVNALLVALAGHDVAGVVTSCLEEDSEHREVLATVFEIGLTTVLYNIYNIYFYQKVFKEVKQELCG